MVFNKMTKVFLIGDDVDCEKRAEKILMIMGVYPNNIFGNRRKCDVLSTNEKKERLIQLLQCDAAVLYSLCNDGVAINERDVAKISRVTIFDMEDLEKMLCDYIIERFNKILDINIPLSVNMISSVASVCSICPFFDECSNKNPLACRLSEARKELGAKKEEDQNENRY